MARSVTDEVPDQSMLERRATSVAHLFRDRVAQTPGGEAFRYPEGAGWTSLTWEQTRDRAYVLAAGLIDVGLEPEQRVSVMASTRLEWILTDLAIMCAGGATTTIYPTTVEDDVAYIVADSGSRVVVAETSEHVDALRHRRAELPEVLAVVVLDGEGDGDWVMSFADLEARGTARLAAEPGLVDARIDQLTPQHLATIIYTSGTTGRPKGVRLTHDNWTYIGAAVDAIGILGPDDLQFLWLPLSHVLGKMFLVLPMQMGFPTAVAGDVTKIVDNVAVVQPTFMAAAPRIFEKAYGKITTMITAEGGVKAKLFDWAFGVGREVGEIRAGGAEPSGVLALKYRLADKLVLSKVRDRFGGRVRFFISGSAALNPDVARWFNAAGLTIIEGYGLTETTAPATVNRPDPQANVFGTVGWALPGTEVRIAEDGEILVKGPGVMSGYHNLPEATAEVLHDGWFSTGDIGTLDDQGYLTITDRKKDLFKTSGGKYVAPSHIESMFKGICPYASQLVIEGDGRRFVSALITLDPDSITAWAAQHGMAGDSYAQIVSSPQCREMVQGYVDELNSQLNRWEQIKQFYILDHDLSVEEGDLTPSMKLKRKQVIQKYKQQLDAFYTES